MTVLLTLAGIGVPSALIVLAVRRWIAPLSWRIALVFVLATLVFLHRAVFTSRLPVPIDEALRGDPYRGVIGDVVAKNPLLTRRPHLFLPWMQVAREELFHLRAPLWNRYAFSGYPLLANAEAAPFSPLFLSTLFVPLPKQIVAMAGLKLFCSLLFMYLLLKREGASDGAAMFAAVPYGFSSFEMVVLYYFSRVQRELQPSGRRQYFRPELPIVRAIGALAPREPFRIAGFNLVLLPNAAAQYGLEDIRGSDPVSLARYTRLLERTGEIEPQSDVIRLLRPDQPLLDFLGVRFVLAEPDAAFGGKWRLVYRGADGALFANPQARPRFWAEGAEVEVRQTSTADFLAARTSAAARHRALERARCARMAGAGGRAARGGEGGGGGVRRFRRAGGREPGHGAVPSAAFYAALPGALAGVLMLFVFGARS